jgi:hypothetical protein
MTRPCVITWCRWNQPTAPDRNLLILKHDAVLATRASVPEGANPVQAFKSRYWKPSDWAEISKAQACSRGIDTPIFVDPASAEFSHST